VGLTRLPASRAEADKIMELTSAGEGMQVLGFEVNRARVMSPSLGEYRIIHFATHGILNTEHPALSGLVLSQFDEQGRPQDGFLRLHDIYNLNLPVEVVVLSACDTGLGKDIRGEGLFGLTRGFMYAGASSVVASLWKVDDEATAEFMNFFYRGMLQEGLPPAAALRKAQITMRGQKRWRSPYYWSAFVLQGNYDVKVNASPARARYRWAAAAALVLLAGLLYAVFRRSHRSQAAH
jgi:CHAT domain-containing protein